MSLNHLEAPVLVESKADCHVVVLLANVTHTRRSIADKVEVEAEIGAVGVFHRTVPGGTVVVVLIEQPPDDKGRGRLFMQEEGQLVSF